jgi:hypothetical protein
VQEHDLSLLRRKEGNGPAYASLIFVGRRLSFAWPVESRQLLLSDAHATATAA